MAEEVRQEVESQLRAKNMLDVGARLSCSHVWKGVKPHLGLHGYGLGHGLSCCSHGRQLGQCCCCWL